MPNEVEKDLITYDIKSIQNELYQIHKLYRDFYGILTGKYFKYRWPFYSTRFANAYATCKEYVNF